MPVANRTRIRWATAGVNQTLIEYRVEDILGSKAVFEQDPIGGGAHGVTHPDRLNA